MTIYETVMLNRRVKGADRPLLSLIAAEICIDGKPICDVDAIKKLTQMKKNCQKTIDLMNDRVETGVMELSPDLADIQKLEDEKYYLQLIENYLPKGAEVSDIEAAIIATGVERNMKSMGRVMGYLKSNFAVVDGNLVKSALMGGK